MYFNRYEVINMCNELTRDLIKLHTYQGALKTLTYHKESCNESYQKGIEKSIELVKLLMEYDI